MSAAVDLWADECVCGHLETTHAGTGGPCCAPKCTCVRFDRERLDRMDAGEPVAMARLDDEEESVLEKVAELDALGPDGAGVSSSPKTRWTRETAVAAIREVGERVGGAPSVRELLDAGYSGAFASSTLKRIGATFADLTREAGFEPRVRGQRKLRESSGREPQAPDGQEVQTAATAAGRNRDDAPPAPSRDGNASASHETEREPAEQPSRPDESLAPQEPDTVAEDEAATFQPPTVLELLTLARGSELLTVDREHEIFRHLVIEELYRASRDDIIEAVFAELELDGAAA